MHQIFQRNERNHKTMLTDLNADCIFLIIDHLNLKDLLNVVQINYKFSMLAVAEFRHKYSHAQIVIHDGDQISNTFKHFGYLIQKLKVETYFRTEPLQMELIGESISNYSFESLLDIDIERNAEKLLEHITRPLINVRNVTLRKSRLQSRSQTILRPNELFPSIRRLNMHFMNDDSLAYFDCYMPHLEHVSVTGDRHNSSPLLEIITKNLQIRSIYLWGIDHEFVQRVSTLLPQLETLTLSNYIVENRSNVELKKVTTFFLKYRTSPDNLHFPQLKTLHIECSSDHYAQYHKFLNEHNHLSHLHLSNYDTDESLQQLTANLSNLEELTVEPRTFLMKPMKSKVIVEFLRSHEIVIQLNVINFPSNWDVELEEQLKQGWNIRINGNAIHFKRRKSTKL